MTRRWVKWTEKEDEFLIKHYGKMRSKDIELKLKRPKGGVSSRARILGILRKRSDFEVAELPVKQVVTGGLFNIG